MKIWTKSCEKIDYPIDPMRLLLISDTHGKLGTINELSSRMRADAVIHAGDFGFYDDGSFERLSDRELRLHVTHSDLPRAEKDNLLTLSRIDLIAQARELRLLGEFQSYFDGRDSFQVPVYAVWGNHEDKEVVERLFSGDVAVANLHMLHHRQGYRVGPVYVYGLGGNLLPGSKMMQRPIAGGGGKIWSTLSQYAELVQTVEKESAPGGPRLFVSHVSPGKEPFVELIGARTRADYTISGHMGAPTCMVWNPFAVSSVDEAQQRLREGLTGIKNACAQPISPWAEQALASVEQIPQETIAMGRGIKAPRWYREMTHINLPDAHIGYAVMDIDGDKIRIQSFVR
jgi:predicted phosphodiesterase